MLGPKADGQRTRKTFARFSVMCFSLGLYKLHVNGTFQYDWANPELVPWD